MSVELVSLRWGPAFWQPVDFCQELRQSEMGREPTLRHEIQAKSLDRQLAARSEHSYIAFILRTSDPTHHVLIDLLADIAMLSAHG